MHQAGLLEVVPRAGWREPARAAEQASCSAPLTRLVEPRVRFAGADGESRVLREEEHEIERRNVGRTEPLAASRGPGRAGPQEERHVRADRERGPAERLAISNAEGARQATEHRRGVRRAAAQPRRHRRALVDAHGDRVAQAEPLAERDRGAGGQVRLAAQLGAAGDMAGDGPGPRRDAHVHPIAQVERRHEREDVVVAVGPGWPDAQDQVHLGRGDGGEAHGLPLPRNRVGPDPGFGSRRGLG